MSDPFLGEIRMFGGNFAPVGWAMCDGQILGIQQNAALYAILGTTYGGNGQSTFGLPDLRGRSAVGWGTGPGLASINYGEKAGSENTQLTINELPRHSHPIQVSTEAASTNTATTALVLAQSGDPNLNTVNIYGTPTSLVTLASSSCGAVGNSLPFSNRSPCLGVSMIIALQGIFPSRP